MLNKRRANGKSSMVSSQELLVLYPKLKELEELKKAANRTLDIPIPDLSPKAWTMLFFLGLSTIQLALSCGSYSGYNTPPMYGDFEAQRHWMEITINLPRKEWYANSTNNDLNYWGLDYPPLTAYHSYLLGKISNWINPEWTALHTSRGITDVYHKVFMRFSVSITFFAFYLPALYLLTYSPGKPMPFVLAAFYPGLMMIDNGHFQYNHVSLGFFLWAVYFFRNQDSSSPDKYFYMLGAVMFVCALNFKQMELYHALPIFVFLLSRCYVRGDLKESLWHLVAIGATTIATFGFLWFPLVLGGADPIQILHRIFPFARGIFEDKVANFWYCMSVVYKFKNVFQTEEMLRLSTVLVLCSVMPSLIILLSKPTYRNFKHALMISSLSFFLYSYQVHEKSILLASVPALLLIDDHPSVISLFLTVTNISMFPLLYRDGIMTAIPLTVVYQTVTSKLQEESKNGDVYWVVGQVFALIGQAFCIVQTQIEPPEKYPHIYPLINAVYSYLYFTFCYLYFTLIIVVERISADDDKKKSSVDLNPKQKKDL